MAAQRQGMELKTTVLVLGDNVPFPKKTWEHDPPKSWVEKYEPARGYIMVVVREFGKDGRLTLEFEHERFVFEEYVLHAQGDSPDKPPQFWVVPEMPGDNIAPDLIRLAPNLTLLCDKPITSPREDIYTDAVEGAWWGLSRKLRNGWRVTYQHEVFAPLRRQITGPTVIPSRKRERE